MTRSSLPTFSNENDDASPTRKATWNRYLVFLILLGITAVFKVGFEAGKRVQDSSSEMEGLVAIKKETTSRIQPDTTKNYEDDNEEEFLPSKDETEIQNESKEVIIEEEEEIYPADLEAKEVRKKISKHSSPALPPQKIAPLPSSTSYEYQCQVIAFNSAGNKILFREHFQTPSTDIASILPVDDGTIGVLALGAVPGGGGCHLEGLADLVDNFLTPRMEWRIVAERFDDPSSSSSHEKLFYDPVMHISSTKAMDGTSRFLTRSAVVARRTILDDLKDASSDPDDEEGMLKQNGIDFILVRVQDEQIVALADALRRHQFPSGNCDAFDERTLGRTFLLHGGSRDFLGAFTSSNTNAMIDALNAGLPFVSVLPPIWGRTYHFDNCTSSNGLECGFLPIHGGQCLERRVQPVIECLSKFQLGSLEKMVLPRVGIPESVCHDSIEQLPAPAINEIPEEDLPYYYCNGPPDAYRQWCPNCGFGGHSSLPSAELLGNATAALNFDDIRSIKNYLPVRNYYDMKTIYDFFPPNRVCGMKVPPLQCHGEVCCYDETMIPQNVLGISDIGEVKRPVTKMIEIAMSTFMIRFNRASRRRVARLHQPRVEAIHSRQQGWDEALAVGNCATLHIRRGDNINRCEKGESDFCAMNLTLADYMYKAVPMLTQLNQSKHVFIMTDDPDVASPEKMEPWVEQGYILEVISGHNQYSKETYSDYDPFLESLHAAEACRAMVGHYISTVSKLVFRKMCTRWGECPIVDMMKHPPPRPTT